MYYSIIYYYIMYYIMYNNEASAQSWTEPGRLNIICSSPFLLVTWRLLAPLRVACEPGASILPRHRKEERGKLPTLQPSGQQQVGRIIKMLFGTPLECAQKKN